jgi:WD40 repeat protein
MLLALPVAWQQDDGARASPEANSARKELQQLQEKYGLALEFVDQRGRISVLSFQKREFVARSRESIGSSGRVTRDGHYAALWAGLEPLSLAVVGLDGSVLKKYSGFRGYPLCWSYDGFRLMLGTPERHLQVMDVASGDIQTLPIEGATDQQVITSQCESPDGKKIVYRSNDGYVSVYDFEMGSSISLAKGENPTWSPVGDWIAFRDGETYYAIRPSGEGRKKLFHKTRAISGLWWSPDARFVAYIHEDLISFLGYSRVMVRRLADGSEVWVAQGVGAGDSFQWVQNPELVWWMETALEKHWFD